MITSADFGDDIIKSGAFSKDLPEVYEKLRYDINFCCMKLIDLSFCS